MLENNQLNFFKERINKKGLVLYKDQWQTPTIDEEIIKIKNKPAEKILVRRSHHGPLITDVLSEYYTGTDPISMSWEYDRPDNDLLTIFYDISHCENQLTNMEKEVKKIKSPGFNIIYANNRGDIAWWAVGNIQVAHSNQSFRLFLDGNREANSIFRYLTDDEKPKKINPTEGFVVTANNKPDNALNLEGYYCIDQRADLLRKKLHRPPLGGWTTTLIKDMQLDDETKLIDKIRPLLVELSHEIDTSEINRESKKALDLLLKWDGKHQLNSTGATIFYQLLAELVQQVFADKIPSLLLNNLIKSHAIYDALFAIIDNDLSPWWINIKNNQNDRMIILKKSLQRSTDHLNNLLGRNPDQWFWSRVHKIKHTHLLGKKSSLLDKIFSIGPFPVRGGNEVINNLQARLTSAPFDVLFGPSTRRIIDFATPEKSWGINPTGQGGYFFDPYYKDQAVLFAKGKYRPQLLETKKIKGAKEFRFQKIDKV